MDALRFGRQFRALRVRVGRRQIDLAHRSGLSRSLIAAVDRGQIEGVTLGALVRAAAALDADVDVRLRFRGEQLDRLLDEDHARIVDVVVRRLKASGWIVEVEASFSVWGERGSIDVLAFHTATRALLTVEVKSVVPDSQQLLYRLDQKARLAPRLAGDRGWRPQTVSRLVVIGATATARRRIARLATTYDVVLPDRGIEVRRWIRRPDRSLRGLVFVAFGSHTSRSGGVGGRERVRGRPERFSGQ